MLLSIILNGKVLILLIIICILLFLLGYRIASVRASKMFARMMLDLQNGKIKIKIVEMEEDKEKDKQK